MPSKALEYTVSDYYRVVNVNPDKNLYRLIVKDGSGNEYIGADGSDKTVKFELPDEVRLRKVGLNHTTSTSTTRSTDLCTFKFGVHPWGKELRPAHWLVDETFNEDVKVWKFGDAYEEPVQSLELMLNTTNTDRVSVYIDVQVVGKGA